ncbi:MAG: lipoprotein-releasing ABC transporter permease subunit [Porticoccaceae bacterium]|jgi:lipoprotein-releasing system permease protein
MPAMINPLPLFIGLRYVRSKQSEGFFSIVSGLSFGAMTLGVMALIIVLSVMNGFDREIKTRILNVVPHLTIEHPMPLAGWRETLAPVLDHPDVVAASPYVEAQGMLSTGDGFEGASIQGLDPANAATLALLADSLVAGSLDGLGPGEYGVVLGSLLARSLKVMTGDSVLLTLPEMTVTPVGVFPRVKRLRVVGVFEVGAQVDGGIAFIHLVDAQRLLRTGDAIQGVRLGLADPFAVERVLAELAPGLPEGARASSWQQSLRALFDAIKMEKLVVGVLLAVIIMVAAFNIVASLVLMVADKRKDIAVLRAMGATSATVTGIFRVQGAAVGLSGVLLGTVAGCLLAWQLGAIVAFFEGLLGVAVFDPEIYFISELPSDLQWPDVAIVAGLGVIISLLATLYPAWRAGQVSPAEVLRYEH